MTGQGSSKQVSFNKRVRAINVLHVYDYTDDEVYNTWYTKGEYKLMKCEMRVTIDMMESKSQNFTEGVTFTSRGLEDKTEVNRNRKLQHRLNSLLAVLQEQDRQFQKEAERQALREEAEADDDSSSSDEESSNSKEERQRQQNNVDDDEEDFELSIRNAYAEHSFISHAYAYLVGVMDEKIALQEQEQSNNSNKKRKEASLSKTTSSSKASSFPTVLQGLRYNTQTGIEEQQRRWYSPQTPPVA